VRLVAYFLYVKITYKNIIYLLKYSFPVPLLFVGHTETITQTKNLLIAIGYCNDIGWLSALLNLLTG
jgi:hypothetical protein